MTSILELSGEIMRNIINDPSRKTIYQMPAIIVTYEGGITKLNYDGYEYKIVLIGGRWWMAENLRTTRFSNGNTILSYNEGLILGQRNREIGIDRSETDFLEKPMYLEYLPSPTSKFIIQTNNYLSECGRLYNWSAVYTDLSGGKLAPNGWHIPSEDEWKSLILELGGNKEAFWKMIKDGNEPKLKWNHEQLQEINASGFSAIKNANWNYSTGFNTVFTSAKYWSSTKQFPHHKYNESKNDFAVGLEISYNKVTIIAQPQSNFAAVRCVRDK
jgi:uncharacterized protein (TIGR02145 family)